MSIVSSLVLLLLWFSIHACDAARSFGVLPNDTAKEFDHSISKENEKLNIPATVSIQPEERKASIPNDARRGDVAKEESSRFEKEKINSEVPNDEALGDRIKVSNTQKSETVANSVSWRVPHKKRGEQEPGFNLDYLPPKTHPPVHN